MKIFVFVILIIGFVGCSDDNGVGIPMMPDPIPDPEPLVQLDIKTVDDKVAAFMNRYDIPGASLAVSVREKMVYAKGYGKANETTGEEVTVESVFRLASISKLFTSIGIYKLIDDGKLDLDDKVFGAGAILGDDFGSARLTSDEKEITLDHLLYNSAGGWSIATGADPIDYRPETDGDEFIEYLLKEWDLTYSPGEEFAYSNTGYWLLARVIEKTSGKSYKAFFTDLFQDVGITTFHTTDFKKSGRQPNEVEYHGQGNDAQYIYGISPKRDGDGGVVISASDLLRALCAIDGFGNRADVLSAESLLSMKTISSLQPNWGRGIGVWNSENILYMTGSLPGTRTWCMRGDNGVSAVLLTNSRSQLTNFDMDFQRVLYDVVKDTSIPWIKELDQF